MELSEQTKRLVSGTKISCESLVGQFEEYDMTMEQFTECLGILGFSRFSMRGILPNGQVGPIIPVQQWSANGETLVSLDHIELSAGADCITVYFEYDHWDNEMKLGDKVDIMDGTRQIRGYKW